MGQNGTQVRSIKLVIYGLAFVMPPLMIGVLFTLSAVSELMIHKTPQPLPAAVLSSVTAPNSGAPKLNAAILMSNAGTELTDLLGPYEILASSGAFHVYTVAPEKRLSPTTGAVDIVPQYSFKDAPTPDLLVIPAILDPSNPEEREWVRATARSASLTLVLCEGARIAALAGILDNHYATSHFVALKSLPELYPQIHWVQGARYVSDGNVISSAGITASLDATLYAIEKLKSRETAENTASGLGYSWNRLDDPSGPALTAALKDSAAPKLGAADYFQLVLKGGFDWTKHSVSVFLYPGVSELAVAAALDTYPRALTAHISTLAKTRSLITTRHGLSLYPTEAIADYTHPDLLIVPSGSLVNLAAPDSALLSRSRLVENLSNRPAGKGFEDSLNSILRLDGGTTTRLIAKLIEYPLPAEWAPASDSSAYPFSIAIRPFLLGLCGILLARLLIKKVAVQFARKLE